MHPEAWAWLSAQSGRDAATVVEFGARNINGSVRPLFNGGEFIGVDIAPGDGVDVVCDAGAYQPDEPVDVVVTAETLEHVERPRSFLYSARRALKPGGLLLLTCATDPRAPHSAGDGGPLGEGEHYRNIEPGELRSWLVGFRDIHIEVHRDRGDLYCRAWRDRG